MKNGKSLQQLATEIEQMAALKDDRVVVRTYAATNEPQQGLARAFLSDRYRVRDNDHLAAHILPFLGEIPDVRIESCELTETRMYIKAVTPRVEGEIGVGDFVQAGVVIRNSEVGHGSLSVQPMVFRLVCLNGMVHGAAERHYHVGRQVDSDDSGRVFSDATLALDDAAFFSKVTDVVKAAVSETAFETVVHELREARFGIHIQEPVKAMERVQQRFRLADGERESVLRHLIEGHDLSAYGLLNAVTRASQDVEDYERASEMEVMGGQVLALASSREWDALARA